MNYFNFISMPIIEIKMYNLPHILILLFFPTLAILSYFLFKGKSEKSKLIFIWSIFIFTFVITYSTYIVSLITNYNNTRTNFFSELPLHMCSINVLFYPIFFALRNKFPKWLSSTTFAYMYFLGSMGAFVAMVVTAPYDCVGEGVNLLRYNVLSYWLKHGFIFITPFIYVALGFYRPRFKDIFKGIAFYICLLMIMEYFNLVSTQLNYKIGSTAVSNYFYAATGEGTAVLEIVWKWIPIEFVYLLPFSVIAVPIFFLLYLPFGIVDLINKNKKNKVV